MRGHTLLWAVGLTTTMTVLMAAADVQARIIRYQANADPTTVDAHLGMAGNQFWNLSVAGTPVGNGIVDGATPAWDLNTSGDNAHEEFWTTTPQVFDNAFGNTGGGWKLSANVRMPTVNDAAGFAAAADYASGTKVWQMQWGTDGDGDPIVRLFDNSTNPSFTLEGAGNSGYHLYELRYDTVAANADLYVDGIERISNFGGFAVGFTRVIFGDLALGDDGHVRYNLVQWEAPEPTGMAMLMIGAGSALLRRRGRRLA